MIVLYVVIIEQRVRSKYDYAVEQIPYLEQLIIDHEELLGILPEKSVLNGNSIEESVSEESEQEEEPSQKPLETISEKSEESSSQTEGQAIAPQIERNQNQLANQAFLSQSVNQSHDNQLVQGPSSVSLAFQRHSNGGPIVARQPLDGQLLQRQPSGFLRQPIEISKETLQTRVETALKRRLNNEITVQNLEEQKDASLRRNLKKAISFGHSGGSEPVINVLQVFEEKRQEEEQKTNRASAKYTQHPSAVSVGHTQQPSGVSAGHTQQTREFCDSLSEMAKQAEDIISQYEKLELEEASRRSPSPTARQYGSPRQIRRVQKMQTAPLRQITEKNGSDVPGYINKRLMQQVSPKKRNENQQYITPKEYLKMSPQPLIRFPMGQVSKRRSAMIPTTFKEAWEDPGPHIDQNILEHSYEESAYSSPSRKLGTVQNPLPFVLERPVFQRIPDTRAPSSLERESMQMESVHRMNTVEDKRKGQNDEDYDQMMKDLKGIQIFSPLQSARTINGIQIASPLQSVRSINEIQNVLPQQSARNGSGIQMATPMQSYRDQIGFQMGTPQSSAREGILIVSPRSSFAPPILEQDQEETKQQTLGYDPEDLQQLLQQKRELGLKLAKMATNGEPPVDEQIRKEWVLLKNELQLVSALIQYNRVKNEIYEVLEESDSFRNSSDSSVSVESIRDQNKFIGPVATPEQLRAAVGKLEKGVFHGPLATPQQLAEGKILEKKRVAEEKELIAKAERERKQSEYKADRDRRQKKYIKRHYKYLVKKREFLCENLDEWEMKVSKHRFNMHLFSVLTEDMTSGFKSLCFHVNFLLRRLFMVLIAFLLRDHSMLQVILYILLAIATTVYVTYARPFLSRSQASIEIFNEFVILVILEVYAFILAQAETKMDEKRFGTVQNSLIFLLLSVNLGSMVAIGLYKNWHKIVFHYRQRHTWFKTTKKVREKREKQKSKKQRQSSKSVTPKASSDELPRNDLEQGASQRAHEQASVEVPLMVAVEEVKAPQLRQSIISGPSLKQTTASFSKIRRRETNLLVPELESRQRLANRNSSLLLVEPAETNQRLVKRQSSLVMSGIEDMLPVNKRESSLLVPQLEHHQISKRYSSLLVLQPDSHPVSKREQNLLINENENSSRLLLYPTHLAAQTYDREDFSHAVQQHRKPMQKTPSQTDIVRLQIKEAVRNLKLERDISRLKIEEEL